MKKDNKNILFDVSRTLVLIAIVDFLILVASYKFLNLNVFTRYFYAYFIVSLILGNMMVYSLDCLALASAEKRKKVEILINCLKKISKTSFVFFLLLLIISSPIAKLLSPKDINLAATIRIFSLTVLLVPSLRIIYMILAKSKIQQYYLYLFEKLIILLSLIFLSLLKGNSSLGDFFYITVVTIAWIMAPLILFVIIRSKPKKKREKKNIISEEILLYEKKEYSKLVVIYMNLFVIIDFILIALTLRLLKYSQSLLDEILFAFSSLSFKLSIILIVLVVIFIYKNLVSIKEALASGNDESVKNNIDIAVRKSLFMSLPIALLISFLSEEMWLLFIGKKALASSVLPMFSFMIISLVLSLSTIIILLITGHKKALKKSIKVALIVKLVLVYFIISSFTRLGIAEYNAVIISSLLAQLIIFGMNLNYLSKIYHFNIEKTTRLLFDNLFIAVLMTTLIWLLKFFINLENFNNPLIVILAIALPTIFIYLYITSKIGLQRTLIRRR